MWYEHVEAGGTAARAIEEHGLFDGLGDDVCTAIAVLLGSLERVLDQAALGRRAKAFGLILTDAPKLLDLGVAKPDLVDALRDMGIAAGIPELEADDALALVFSAREEARQGNGQGTKRGGPEPTAGFVAPQPIDIASWVGKAPPRRWAVSKLIPRRSVTLISAIGGSGKSYVALQMAVAHALARDWFGHMPEPGPALYVTAEEDEGDIRERLELIAEFYGSTTAEIARAGLVIESLANLDDPFCFIADRNSKVASTSLWNWLAQKVATIKPVNIVLDPITDMAAINENWRREVTQVYGHCRRLAQRADCGLVLTGHVSKGGDYSGNTAWHNSARSRFMLGPSADDADSDVRYLVHEKNQHGPLAATIAIEWKDGLWRMVSSGEAPLRGTARKEAINRVTFQLIGQATRQGRSISSDPMNGSGQLAVAHEAGGSSLRISKLEFRVAIAELLKEKTIRHYDGEKTSHGDKRRVLRAVETGDEQPSET